MGLLDLLSTIWLYRYIEIYISIVGMAVSLWMGLYLLRRGAGTLVGILGATALLLVALIYAFEAMLDAPGITARQYEMLLRTQALTVPSAIFVWVALAFLVRNKRRVTNTVKRVWLGTTIVGGIQVWLRAFTDWHYDYANIYTSPFPWQDWWTPPGPGFATFAALVFAGLVWSVYNVFRPFYDEVGSLRAIWRVAQFWPLFAGAVLFLLSVGYMVVSVAAHLEWPEVIGLAGVTLGIAALGFGIFWHNAFVEEGRDITTDFLYSLVGMSAVIALYMLIIFSVGGFEKLGVAQVVALCAALVITHSLHDVANRLFDNLLERAGFSRWTMGHRLRREMLMRMQREESQDALRERLSALLGQLCREVSTNRGYVALRDGNGFMMQATYGVAPPLMRLSAPGLEVGSIAAIPPPNQVGELTGMGAVVPLIVRGEQVGVVLLGDKRYDEGEYSRIFVHAEAMQRAVEAREVAEEITRLQQELERLQRQQLAEGGDDDKKLLAVCAGAGLSFDNAAEGIAAATDMLENYMEDPYALEESPFLKCSRVQSRSNRSRDRSHAVDILEEEIARTIAAMKPSRQRGYDWQRWTYLHRRYIDRYGEDGRRVTMEEIASALGLSRKTLTRRHDRAIRDFVLAFLDL